MDITKYMKHLPTCNIMQDWSEAETAMADTPEKFRDHDWVEAREELNAKMQNCTCGLIEAKEIAKNISSKPMLADSYPLIEKQLLKTIQGNGLAISRFMEWLKAGNFR